MAFLIYSTVLGNITDMLALMNVYMLYRNQTKALVELLCLQLYWRFLFSCISVNMHLEAIISDSLSKRVMQIENIYENNHFQNILKLYYILENTF